MFREESPKFYPILQVDDVSLAIFDELLPPGITSLEDFRGLMRSYVLDVLAAEKRGPEGAMSQLGRKVMTRLAGSASPGILAHALFDVGLRAAVLRNGGKVAGRRGVIQFRVPDVPGASWRLALGRGKPSYSRGEAVGADSTVSIRASVLRDLMTRRADVARALMRGDIQTGGTLDGLSVLQAIAPGL